MSDIVSWPDIHPTIVKEFPHTVVVGDTVDFEKMAEWCGQHFGEEALVELDAEKPIYRYIAANLWVYGSTNISIDEADVVTFFFKNHQDAVLFRISCT